MDSILTILMTIAINLDQGTLINTEFTKDPIAVNETIIIVSKISNNKEALFIRDYINSEGEVAHDLSEEEIKEHRDKLDKLILTLKKSKDGQPMM